VSCGQDKNTEEPEIEQQIKPNYPGASSDVVYQNLPRKPRMRNPITGEITPRWKYDRKEKASPAVFQPPDRRSEPYGKTGKPG